MKRAQKQASGQTRKSPNGRSKADLSMRRLRSAITNGKFVLAEVDHRSAWMRRLRDLIADAVSDLGGYEQISSAEMILIRRASMLCLQTEMMEQQWAQNDGEANSKQVETYQRITNTLRRTLESLGLHRRARDVTPPNPLDYAQRYDEAEDAEEITA